MASQTQAGPSRTPVRVEVTPLFRSLVADQPSSPSSRTSDVHRPPGKAKAAEVWHKRRRAEKQWNQEAQKLGAAVQSLHQFLSSIRRAYLHLGAPPKRYDVLSQPREYTEDVIEPQNAVGQSTLVDSTLYQEQGSLDSYAQLVYLTEAQKDEVDSHLKLVLDRSIERLKELIKAESMRQASQPAPSSTTLARLLAPPIPARELDSLEYSAQLTQHREAITSHLGARLKRAGERVGLMQEARVRAWEERSGARRGVSSSRGVQDTKRSAAGGSTSNKILAGSTSSFAAIAENASAEGGRSGHGELTQEQEQLFASEASAFAKTLESDLAAVDAVSRTLSTISELQATLISHLSQQNETIANLGSEALDQRVEVQKGNEQLKKAKERNRSANRLLGALLVGSGLGLLFLHVMD